MMAIQKTKKLIRFVSVAFVILGYSVGFFASLVPIPRVSAQGENYLLYYPDDEATKKKLKDLYNDGEKIDDSDRQYVSILASGGTMFGSQPQRMVYDLDVNKQMSYGGGGTNCDVGDCTNSDEQFFSRVYYCTQTSGDLSWSRPSGSQKYYRVTYTIGMKISDADELFKTKVHNDVWVGATKIQLITPATTGGTGQAGDSEKTENIKSLDWHDGPGELDNDIDKITNAACRPKPVGGPGKIAVKNYYSGASQAERDQVASLLAAAKAGGGTGSGEKDDSQADCSMTASPLSWILCPVIDLGVNMSDFVFEKFITPFMEDVPISTDPRDGAYKAWQQFRILANVLLVGTLLAVVYAQIRGDK